MISLGFLRPVRVLVLPVKGELLDVGAVDAHPVDLPHAAAIRLERQPLTVGRPRRLLVRALAGEDAALSRRRVLDADLEAPVDARGVGDLVAVRRPCGVVVPIALERRPPY